jgi:hypothetical protein
MAQGETGPGSGEPDDPYYSYKPSLMGAPWEFWLRPDALEWRAGRHQGRTPYENITYVRLSYRPITMQTNRFLTELWSTNGPRLMIASSSWQSMVEQGSQIEAYGAFVRALHIRLADGGRTHFQAGVAGFLYWPGLAAFAAVVLATVALVVRAMLIGEWPAVALLGGFLALFAWYSGRFFQRNRPRPYRPDAVPADLVPLR